MQKITIYGIKNCDTVKKATRWLDAHKLNYIFVDYREQVPETKQLRLWLQAVGSEKLLNKRSTTWKSLSPKQKQGVDSEPYLASLLREYPTLIKRPVLETQNAIFVGFSEQSYQGIFQS